MVIIKSIIEKEIITGMMNYDNAEGFLTVQQISEKLKTLSRANTDKYLKKLRDKQIVQKKEAQPNLFRLNKDISAYKTIFSLFNDAQPKKTKFEHNKSFLLSDYHRNNFIILKEWINKKFETQLRVRDTSQTTDGANAILLLAFMSPTVYRMVFDENIENMEYVNSTLSTHIKPKFSRVIEYGLLCNISPFLARVLACGLVVDYVMVPETRVFADTIINNTRISEALKNPKTNEAFKEFIKEMQLNLEGNIRHIKKSFTH